jgi:histone-lysine N-methyltransferase SETMAR
LFLQDNAAPHKAANACQKLADLHFGVPKRLAYSLELALSDFYIFPNLKKDLKGRKFSSIVEPTLAAKEFFMVELKKLERRNHKCVELRGEYVE